MYAIFFFIWKYPDIIIDLDDDNLERNAMDFDFEGVSKRNIEYFLFFETKYENPTWNDLLRIVSRTMFEREPEQFLTPEIYDKLGITQNPDNSNRYIQLSNTYYINANLSAKYILRRVQLILEKFEIEDELIIKLKNNSKQ